MKNYHGRISFWLVPSQHYQALYQPIINDLSKRFISVPFSPHVTVFSTPFSTEESYNHVLKNITARLRPVTLYPIDIGFSEKFTQTLYLKFKPSRRLVSLSKALKRAVITKSNYMLDPHLSLLYAQITQTQQEEAAKRIIIPRKKIIFDQIKAVSVQTHVHSSKDVKGWVEIASANIHI